MWILIFSLIFSLLFQLDQCLAQKNVLKPETSAKQNNAEKYNEISKDEELYRLLLSAFLGAGKLQEAEKLAKKATSMFPKNSFWWKTYADILIWNGKAEEAIVPLVKAFEISKDRSIAEKAFRLAFALKKYDIAKQLLSFVKTSPQEKQAIYEGLGDVEGLIKILKQLTDKDSKVLLSEILFLTGRKEESLEILNEIEKLHAFTVKEVLLKANILYSQKKFAEALEVFKKFYHNVKPEEKEFWNTFSDLAWMLQDWNSVKYASFILIKSGQAQLQDYDRLSTVLSFEDSQKAIEVSFEGWKKLKSRLLLEKAFYLAYSTENWDKILKMFSLSEPEMFNNDNILIAYLTALRQMGKNKESLNVMESVLKERLSKPVLSFYIYSLIELEELKKLRKILIEYGRYQFDSEVAQAFCNAYLNLQNGHKAYEIYKKASINDPVLMADILSLSGKEWEAKNLRVKEFKKRTDMIKQNRELLKDPEFLRIYLSLGIYSMNAPTYEKLLYEAKQTLSAPVWKDIYLSYLFYHEKKEKVLRLAKFYKYPLKPWMWLNLALWQDDRYLMSEMLENNADMLPIRDRVIALQRTGEIKKSLYYASKGLKENIYDSLLYKDFRDAIVKYEDKFSSEISYLKRKELSGIQIENELYIGMLQKGFGLGLNFDSFSPISRNSSELSKTVFVQREYLFFEKIFDRGFARIYMGQIKSLNENFSAKLYGEMMFSQNITVFYEIGKNLKTDETLYLLLDGMKDSLKVGAYYNITPKTLFHLELQQSSYYSSDRERIGRGFNYNADVQYKLRTGYPDYVIRFYTNYGTYSEKEKKGSISELSPYEDFKALPENYFNTGIEFSYGFENRDSYTRVWRPFFSFDTGYNSIGAFSFATLVGVGGSVLSKDNLSLQLGFEQNKGGLKDNSLRITFSYKIWF